RQAVRGQDQQIVRQARQTIERIHEELQRIAVRLVLPDADMRRDARQYLVSGDQHLVLRAEEQRLLGRMPFAEQDGPGAAADLDQVIRNQSVKSAGDRRKPVVEGAEERLDVGRLRLAEPVAREVAQAEQ